MSRFWRVTGETPTSARREVKGRKDRKESGRERSRGERRESRGRDGRRGPVAARRRGGCGVSPLAASGWRREIRRSRPSPPSYAGRPPPHPPHPGARACRTARRPPSRSARKTIRRPRAPSSRPSRGFLSPSFSFRRSCASTRRSRRPRVRRPPGSPGEFQLRLAIVAAARGTSTPPSPRPRRSTIDPREKNARVARARAPACVCATRTPPRADGDQRVGARWLGSHEFGHCGRYGFFSGFTNPPARPAVEKAPPKVSVREIQDSWFRQNVFDTRN